MFYFPSANRGNADRASGRIVTVIEAFCGQEAIIPATDSKSHQNPVAPIFLIIYIRVYMRARERERARAYLRGEKKISKKKIEMARGIIAVIKRQSYAGYQIACGQLTLRSREVTLARRRV